MLQFYHARTHTHTYLYGRGIMQMSSHNDFQLVSRCVCACVHVGAWVESINSVNLRAFAQPKPRWHNQSANQSS